MGDTVAKKDTTKTTPTDDEKRKEVVIPSRTIDLIILHCTATPDGKPHTVAQIDAGHLARGWHRKASWKKLQNPDLTSIGYHFVIYPDGSVHTGRHEMEQGAHVQGMNVTSLGVSMVGSYKFTQAQWTSLASKVAELESKYSVTEVHGHNEYAAKDCPGFKVKDWLDGGRKPLAANLIEEPKPATPATPTSGPQ
ncbi:MAG: N-acetylmuramoyl-L-alanine amidase [Deltaproteobacteria bacterium]|nr:N-acetylmuramoyl-L-alanine amidase [Deltaproteobacteria bacterium]